MAASAKDISSAYGINMTLASEIVAVAHRVGIPDPAMLAQFGRTQAQVEAVATAHPPDPRRRRTYRPRVARRPPPR